MLQGSRIRTYRKLRKVGQQELALAMGLKHASSISRLERREVTNLEFIDAIAAIERLAAHRDKATDPGEAMRGVTS